MQGGQNFEKNPYKNPYNSEKNPYNPYKSSS